VTLFSEDIIVTHYEWFTPSLLAVCESD